MVLLPSEVCYWGFLTSGEIYATPVRRCEGHSAVKHSLFWVCVESRGHLPSEKKPITLSGSSEIRNMPELMEQLAVYSGC